MEGDLPDEPGVEPAPHPVVPSSNQLAAQFAEAGVQLADAIVRALPVWVSGCVSRFVGIVGIEGIDDVAVSAAAVEAVASVEGPLRDLLSAPIDEQRSTPLTIVRTAVSFPTSILARAGVAVIQRDPFQVRAFPDDVYGISPATWADLGDDVAEAGMRWSVNKAFLHRHLHRDHHRS
jgi:hypothetical protein